MLRGRYPWSLSRARRESEGNGRKRAGSARERPNAPQHARAAICARVIRPLAFLLSTLPGLHGLTSLGFLDNI